MEPELRNKKEQKERKNGQEIKENVKQKRTKKKNQIQKEGKEKERTCSKRRNMWNKERKNSKRINNRNKERKGGRNERADTVKNEQVDERMKGRKTAHI